MTINAGEKLETQKLQNINDQFSVLAVYTLLLRNGQKSENEEDAGRLCGQADKHRRSKERTG